MKNIFLLILIVSLNSQADDIFDVAEKYNSKKKKVIHLESAKRSVLSDVYDLERKTKKIVEEKSVLGNKKVQMKVSLKKTSQEIISIESELKEMTPQLQKRLSYAHKIQDLPWMYAFISSYSVTDLDRMVRTFENINEREAEVTLGYFKKLEVLKTKKEKLNKIALEMIGLSKTISLKEKDIKSQHLKKKKILSKLKSNIDKNLVELSKIKKKGKRLTANPEYKNFGILFGTAFFDKKGELPHPIDAPIKHFYGLNEDLLKDNVELFHKGLFYKAKKNKSVQSIAEGRVKLSQRINGLGGVLIIDHGGRYYSVYANLKKIKVRKGDIVQAKEKIATVGSSSIQFKEGLYFEIRHFSESQDPEKWLKKKNNQLAGL